MHRFPPKLSAVVLAVLAAGLSTPASAHVGDHSHMSFADLADHILTKLDHRLGIAAVVLLASVAGLFTALTRRKARAGARAARFPETPAT
jgi:hypothetical protein